MKEKQVIYKALEVEDVEKIASELLGRKVSIGEIEIVLYDDIFEDENGETHIGTTCDMSCESYEGYFETEDYECPLDKYMPPQDVLLPTDLIFDFDTDLLAAFERGYYQCMNDDRYPL